MTIIPKIFITDGVKASQQAKEAVTRIKNAIKTETITPNQLLREPASDLFEKKAYMETEAFWHDPQTFANFARGQYLTEGGKEIEEAMLSREVKEKIIEKTDKIERKFSYGIGQVEDTVVYSEKDLLTGETRYVHLKDGKPYYSARSGDSKFIYHDPKTGAPTIAVSRQQGLKITRQYRPDGKVIKNTGEKVLANGNTRIYDFDPKGDWKRVKTFNKEGKLISMEINKGVGSSQEIEINPLTGQIKKITDYDSSGKKLSERLFDQDGNLEKSI